MPGGNAAEALRTALHHKHGQAEGRTRAALRRVGFSAQELDYLQRTVVQWLSADSGAAGAFHRMLGARRVPDALWTVRRPDATGTV